MNLPAPFQKSCFLLSLFPVVISEADTLQLNSGQQVIATVTKYANYSFEVRSADGKTASYPASGVRHIVFDSSNAQAKFTMRTNGLRTGAASSFENGVFNVATPAGARQFPLIFVERAAFVADRGQGIEVIGHGQQVDVTKHLALGNVTIVDFYADWCGPCKQISPTLEQMARTDPEIAVRKIDIVDWTSPVAKQYKITVLPQINIYNRAGKLVGTVNGVNAEKVQRYVVQAKAGS
jgi:thiol-disulfide isomerase/thioredoxin